MNAVMEMTDFQEQAFLGHRGGKWEQTFYSFRFPKGVAKHFKSGPIQLNEVLSLPSKAAGRNSIPT